MVNEYLRWGAGPRAGQALVLCAKAHALLSGRYAVTHCRSLEDIQATWKRFVQWFEESGHEWGSDGECLEELLSSATDPFDQWEFDLYLPVAP